MKYMLLAFSFITVLTACSKKNDSQPQLTPQNVTVAAVTGKWTIQTDTTYVVIDGKTQATKIEKAPLPPGGYSASIQFNADGTCSSENSNTQFTYTVAPPTINVFLKSDDGVVRPSSSFTVLGITENWLLLRTNVSDGNYDDIAFSKN